MSFGVNRAAQYTYSNNSFTFNANVIANTGFFMTLGPQSAANVTLSNGVTWSSNVFNGLKTYQAGASSVLSSCIFCSNTNVQCNSTSETSIIPTGVGTVTLPANFLTPGKTIKVTIFGFFDATGAGSAGTLACSTYLGTTKVANGQPTGAVNAPVANTVIKIETYATCVSNGATGNIKASIMYSGASITTAGAAANAVGVTVDTTAPLVVNVTATMSSGSGTHLISVNQAFIEVIG
jgi:hypothetical protein